MIILPFGKRQFQYPYSPEANWRIAVSRRFNFPIVDDLYFGYVLPVLEAEGNVLECKYAAETPEQYNYWMNKFSLILEVSDIHVLIDLRRSPNMEYEFNRSKLISRNGVVPSLNNNFGIAISRSRDFVRPIRIYLTKYPKDIPRYTREIIIDINGSYIEVAKKIKEALKWAKKKRLFDLYMAINIYEKMWARIGYSEVGEIKTILISMTQIANMIRNDSSFETIFNEAKKCELSMEYHVDIERQNKIKDFEVKVYKGEIVLPNKYLDRVKYFKKMYRENIPFAFEKFREIGVEPPIWILDTKPGRIFLYILSMRGSSNIMKRIRRLKKESEREKGS